MKYLETAFTQLQLAIKLMHAAEQGVIPVEDIDIPLTVADGRSVIVLPDRALASQEDLIIACQNSVSITFGAAAITLNPLSRRSRDSSS
jgi:hypothetical protein